MDVEDEDEEGADSQNATADQDGLETTMNSEGEERVEAEGEAKLGGGDGLSKNWGTSGVRRSPGTLLRLRHRKEQYNRGLGSIFCFCLFFWKNMFVLIENKQDCVYICWIVYYGSLLVSPSHSCEQNISRTPWEYL